MITIRWALPPILLRSLALGLPLAGGVEWTMAAMAGRPSVVEAFWRFSFAWTGDEVQLLRFGEVARTGAAGLALVWVATVVFGLVLVRWTTLAGRAEAEVDHDGAASHRRFVAVCWGVDFVGALGNLGGVLSLATGAADGRTQDGLAAIAGMSAVLRLAAWSALVGACMVQLPAVSGWLGGLARMRSRPGRERFLWEAGALLVAGLLWWGASAGRVPLVLVCSVVGGVVVPFGLWFRPVREVAVRDFGESAPSPPPEPPRPSIIPLIRARAGTFRLGSPANEPGRWADEGPIEGVQVGEFQIAETPVTRRVWRAVMPEDRWPSEWRGESDDSDLPANYVCWYDALDFCNALSVAEGLSPCYVIERSGDEVAAVRWIRSANGYRLPTEAEWEYAARAGEAGAYPWGDDGREETISAHAWWFKNANGPRPVGTKPPNHWGLRDMIGIVREWCWDAFEPRHDPEGRDGEIGSARAVRGGSFLDAFAPRFLRSAFRSSFGPSLRSSGVGFRVVRVPFRQHG